MRDRTFETLCNTEKDKFDEFVRCIDTKFCWPTSAGETVIFLFSVLHLCCTFTLFFSCHFDFSMYFEGLSKSLTHLRRILKNRRDFVDV